MSGELQWNGDQILAQVEAACIVAIDETTAACVPLGREYVNKDTLTLQSKIVSVPATASGTQASGAYGVVDDPGYALPQEYLPSPQGNSYIRRPAAQVFPSLSGRIAKKLGGR